MQHAAALRLSVCLSVHLSLFMNVCIGMYKCKHESHLVL